MADLYCRKCGGNGTVSVICVNHKTKTYRRTSLCCSACNRHSDDNSCIKQNEEILSLLKSEASVMEEGFIEEICPMVDISSVLSNYYLQWATIDENTEGNVNRRIA